MFVSPPCVLTLVGFGLFANGFDGAVGQSVACVLNGVALVTLLWVHRPSATFWKPFLGPLLLVAGALVWVLAVAGWRALSPIEPDALPYAPDLFLAKYLGTVSGAAALVIGILVGRTSARVETPGDVLLALICLHGAFGLYLFSDPDNPWDHWRPVWEGRFAGLIGNANVTAAICGAACIIAASHGLRYWLPARDPWAPRSAIRATLYAAALILNAVALALTASRFAAGVTVLALAVLAFPRHGETVRRSGIAVLGLFAFAMLLAQSSVADLWWARWDMIGAESLARWQIWQHFADSAAAAFWTGYGPGAFPSLNAFSMEAETWRYSLWRVNSPHDVFLQLLLVGGLPYLLLIVGGGGWIATAIVMRGRSIESREEVVPVLVAGSILLSGVVDIALDMPVTTNLALLFVGIAWQRRGISLLPAPPPVRPTPRRASSHGPQRRVVQRRKTAA